VRRRARAEQLCCSARMRRRSRRIAFFGEAEKKRRARALHYRSGCGVLQSGRGNREIESRRCAVCTACERLAARRLLLSPRFPAPRQTPPEHSQAKPPPCFRLRRKHDCAASPRAALPKQKRLYEPFRFIQPFAIRLILSLF